MRYRSNAISEVPGEVPENEVNTQPGNPGLRMPSQTVARKVDTLMDVHSHQQLVALIRERGIAALGTLHDGGPLVSLVLYASVPDLSALYVHVSHLAQHTRDLL